MRRHVFDLDDTLVTYGRRGLVVPRQTFHTLRDLLAAGEEVVVVSFNPWARVLVSLMGLTRYVARTVTPVSEGEGRAELVTQAIAGWGGDAKFAYYDDRSDNVAAVRERFGPRASAHVVTAASLWRTVREVRGPTGGAAGEQPTTAPQLAVEVSADKNEAPTTGGASGGS